VDDRETAANEPGSTIGAPLGSEARAALIELELVRQELARTRAELAELRSRPAQRARRRVGEAAPAFLDHRWAQCVCGHVEVYRIGRTLRGKGTAKRDPGRLQNQRCKGCSRKLGNGAWRRSQQWTIEERRAMRKAQNALARHTRDLEATFTSGRSSAGAETPVQTSAARVAPRPSSPTDGLEAYKSARIRELGLKKPRR